MRFNGRFWLSNLAISHTRFPGITFGFRISRIFGGVNGSFRADGRFSWLSRRSHSVCFSKGQSFFKSRT